MSVAVKNLAEFDRDVMAWFAAVEEAAAEAAVGLAKRVFDKVLIESPQYSGDFAANWKVSVNAPSTAFKPDAVRPSFAKYHDQDGIKQRKPFGRGDPEAIAHAKAQANWSKIKLGDVIYISNSADHDEAYAFKIEEGKIKFRPVNEGADAVGRRSMQFVANHYPYIGGSQLSALRRLSA